MARMPRLVVPQYPHHMTQRGNRKQRTFFTTEDYRDYIELIAAARLKAGADILAYCLMPNHVHFVVVPKREDSLAVLFADAHRRYKRKVNFREGWRGYLWQGRFFSCVMDEAHLLATVRYVELNPVRANLCSRPKDWPWSSVHAHLAGSDDPLVTVAPMLARIKDWNDYLATTGVPCRVDRVRLHTRTGRPAGSAEFVRQLERQTGRYLQKKSPGRPRK